MRRSRTHAIRGAMLSAVLGVAIGMNAAPALAEDAEALGAYNYHACALRSNGTVWCWGYNGFHQLADGTTDDRSTPVQVETATDMLTGVRQLSPSGYDHTCAIVGEGRVRCWGKNDHGQLGDGTDGARHFPVSVKRKGGGALTGVRSLAVGDHHSCALRGDRTMWCWGDNEHGQLGDRTTTPRYQAVQVKHGPNALTGVRAIGAGIRHSCAVRSDSTLWCWGENQNGELGIGSSDEDPHPRPRRVETANGRPLTGVRHVDGGNEHTCALLTNGTVRCWGRDDQGELGNGAGGDDPSPVKVRRGSGFLTNVTSLDAGYFHSCARTAGGAAYCWGWAGAGQLGMGPVPLDEEAHKAVRVRRNAGSFMGGVRTIRAADSFTCLLETNGTVWCMGFGPNGQMGNGATDEFTYFPVEVHVP